MLKLLKKKTVNLLITLSWWDLDDNIINAITKNLREKPNTNTLKELINKYT